ncbi:MAG: adenosylcobinamide-GDP ribazoletransferase, partial [Methanomassiliicoccales archaeon]|nr:adenosylcobinamide-GDP ribazoletransferase [Methanomassiliicoccales archaeon]
ESLSRHFYLILFVGLLYGLMAGAIMYLVSDWMTVMAAAALTFAMLHLLNRFLHMDGLSDLGDGMVCGGNAERKLAAMKDSKTGAGGVGYALVFSIMSFAMLGSLWGPALFLLPLVAEIANKNAVVFCASGGKAREGLGNMFVSNTGRKQAAISFVLCLGLSILLLLLFEGLFFRDLSFMTIVVALVAALVSSIVGLGMSVLAERNFGAVNGDVLGATNEICRPIVLLLMLLVII